MPGLEIVAFSAEHLDAAAELLKQQHERHRRAEPLLPADVDFRMLVEEHGGGKTLVRFGTQLRPTNLGVVMAAGFGAALVISAAPAPLPPSRSRMSAEPSSNR